jgi:outer membrane protein assembly factor BamA
MLLAALLAAALAVQAPAQESVVEVRIHGNHTTPDADVLAIVGEVIGQPATDTLVGAIVERLEKSGRFSGVDVRRRYRSIDDPSEILLMVVVDERPGVSDSDPVAGPWKRVMASGMWLPVLDYVDGYGFTYGARVSFVDLLGPRTRISTPLTWGGERQAQVEVERRFDLGVPVRISGGGGIDRRENPHYEIGDTRTELRVRAEGSPRPWVRFGGSASVADVDFAEFDDRLSRANVGVTLDTRVDPAFPRNAVVASIDWERNAFSGPEPHAPGDPTSATRSGSYVRTTAELQGYVGVVGALVFAVRGHLATSSESAPPYERLLLGGESLLRGHDLGYRAGDNLAAATAELRLPLTSPVRVGQFGVKAFADWGAVYAHGEALADQRFDAGYGGGVFLAATVLSLGMDLAWSQQGDFNYHFSMGVKLK